jgi:hypothetical protein
MFLSDDEDALTGRHRVERVDERGATIEDRALIE